MRHSASNKKSSSTESHAFIKLDKTGKVLESHIVTVDNENAELNEERHRKKYLLDKAIKDFFAIKDKRDIIKDGLSISVREKDYPYMLAIKDDLSKAIQCSVKISKRAKSKKSEQESVSDRKNYLFNKTIRQFYDLEDKTDILKNGLKITVRDNDYDYMQSIKAEIKKVINCDVNVYRKVAKKTTDIMAQPVFIPEPVPPLEEKPIKAKKRKSKKSLIADKLLIKEIHEIKHKRGLLAILSGPFFSSLLHLCLISSLAILIQDKYKKDVQEIHLTIQEEDIVELDEPQPIEEPLPEEIKDVEGLNPELQAIELETSLLKESGLEENEDIPSVNDDSMIEAITDIEITQSNFTTNSIVAGRSGSGRTASLGRYGGSLAGQMSLMKALWWLKSVQKPDGSWGNGRGTSTAMTALALLTYLAHGETQESKDFGATVNKAVDFLVKLPIDKNTQNGYPHAIMTYALAEAHTMTNISGLEAKMEACVQVLIDGQQEGGCFNYRYSTNEARQDLSFAGWNYQALKAAFAAGCRMEGLSTTIYRSIKWLQNQSFGKFPYSTRNNVVTVGEAKHTMRAVGVLCLQLFGEGRFEGIQDDLVHISTKDLLKYDWEKPPDESLYGWYYATQAMFQAGGEMWKNWNKQFQDVLTRNQNKEGFWDHPGEFHGPKDELTSRIYATTLCAMQLTVYYRYLPSFKEGQDLNIKGKKRAIDEGFDLIE